MTQIKQTIVEKWKPVLNHEEFYEISSHGQVRSLRTGRIKITSYTNKGYESVSLYDSRTQQRPFFRIHTMMAEVFLGHVKGQGVVLHKNRCVQDNMLSNLELAEHRRPRGKDTIPYLNAPKARRYRTSPDVIREVIKYLDEDYNMREVADIVGISRCTVSKINQWRISR